MMSSSQQPLTATTGKDGKFKIQNVPSGTYTVTVKADGYKTWTKQVTVTSDSNLTIKLKPSK